jgi:hypothetical protein
MRCPRLPFLSGGNAFFAVKDPCFTFPPQSLVSIITYGGAVFKQFHILMSALSHATTPGNPPGVVKMVVAVNR